MATSYRSALAILALVLAAAPALAAEARVSEPHFMGSQSCKSSSCHGGGTDKNQNLLWLKHDKHSHAHAILANAQSKQIASGAGIADPVKSARCTVCHSPLEALDAARFANPAAQDRGVSCESCHGPSENWLQFHTRTDTSHGQRVAKGMREARDLYSRANLCVACHHMIDPALEKAGHPSMYFELDGQVDTMLDIKLEAVSGRAPNTLRADGQVLQQKPHWVDEGTWLGPRAWLTGQAAALREISWKLTQENDPKLLARWKAMVWMLRKLPSGTILPESDDFAAMQSASDKLARNASAAQWSKDSALRALQTYGGLAGEFRDTKIDAADQRRRAEVLIFAIDRLWVALKTNAQLKSENFDKALLALAGESRKQNAFNSAKFAAALQNIEVEIELLPKN